MAVCGVGNNFCERLLRRQQLTATSSQNEPFAPVIAVLACDTFKIQCADARSSVGLVLVRGQLS